MYTYMLFLIKIPLFHWLKTVKKMTVPRLFADFLMSDYRYL